MSIVTEARSTAKKQQFDEQIISYDLQGLPGSFMIRNIIRRKTKNKLDVFFFSFFIFLKISTLPWAKQPISNGTIIQMSNMLLFGLKHRFRYSFIIKKKKKIILLRQDGHTMQGFLWLWRQLALKRKWLHISAPVPGSLFSSNESRNISGLNEVRKPSEKPWK